MDNILQSYQINKYGEFRFTDFQAYGGEGEPNQIGFGEDLGKVHPSLVPHPDCSFLEQDTNRSFWHLISSFKPGLIESEPVDIDAYEWARHEDVPYFSSESVRGEVSSPNDTISSENSASLRAGRVMDPSCIAESHHLESPTTPSEPKIVIETWRHVLDDKGKQKVVRVLKRKNQDKDGRSSFEDHKDSRAFIFKFDFSAKSKEPCQSDRVARDPKEMEAVLDFAKKDESNENQGKLLCPSCKKFKPRLFYYLQATERVCNACNQHWRRHVHECDICNRLKAMLADESRRGIALQKLE